MTPGERDVWIAVYAANWTRLRSEKRAWGTSDATLALEAADEAGGAVEALREVRNSPDFGADARAVIGSPSRSMDWKVGDIVIHSDGTAGKVRRVDRMGARLRVLVNEPNGSVLSTFWDEEEISRDEP